MATIYEAIGSTLEEAVTKAHDKIPLRAGRDFVVSRIVNWGMQTGGFVFDRKYYAAVEEDENAPFRTDDDSKPSP